MEITLYDILEAVGEVQETLNNKDTDSTEIEALLCDIKENLEATNECIVEMSDTLAEMNTTVNNTFDTLGLVFFLLCIGAIITTLVKTFFTGW